MAAAKMISETKIRTNKVRFGFADINPKQEDGSIGKSNIPIIIDGDDEETIALIKEASENARAVGVEKFGSQFAKGKKVHYPLHSGDEEKPDNEHYAGKFYLNANSKDPVGMVGPNPKVKIEDPGEFYSGMYGCVTLNFAPYVYNGAGIGTYICNLQKLEDGEHIGFTRATAMQDFADDDDDDFLD